MSNYTKAMGPDAIRANLAKSLKESASALILMAQDYREPAERRLAKRMELLRQGDQHINEATRAFNEWAEEARNAARRRIAEDPVGSAAEESRRVANEMRLSRIIESARALDTAAGAQVVEVMPGESRAVPNPSAYEMADRAMKAYIDGSYEEAVLLGEAAIALGGPRDKAQRAIDASKVQLYTPEQRKAAAELEAVDRAATEFGRDLNATVAVVFQAAVELAHEVGDTPGEKNLRANAAKVSLASKSYAMGLAKVDEYGRIVPGTYVEAEGVLDGGPKGQPLPITRDQYDRDAVHNLDTNTVRIGPA